MSGEMETKANERIKSAFPEMKPSGGHDYVDEIIGLLKIARMHAKDRQHDELKEAVEAEHESGLRWEEDAIAILKLIAREVAAHGDCHCTTNEQDCAYCLACHLGKLGRIKVTDSAIEKMAIADLIDSANST